MRALYLFINGLASSNREHGSGRGEAWAADPDGGLAPIRPGAFARWMTARDASSGPRGPLARSTDGRHRTATPR